jgi:protein involved in polysaccharide export with SLBB domain
MSFLRTPLAKAGLLLSLLLPLSAGAAAGQATTERSASPWQMSRPEMERSLARYETVATSGPGDRDTRMRARQEAALLRSRLTDGDFQPGDRVVLYVEGEPALSDTFVVSQERALQLPLLGEIPLRGVLRAELQPYLQQQIARQIRNPVVRAQSMMRLAVFGGVGRPGFYLIPSSELLTEVIMAAGGPANGARMNKVYVERGGQRIWQGAALQDAIIEGRTLDQLSLRAGDRVVVPTGTSLSNVNQVAWIASTLVSLGYLLTRAF